MGGVKGRIDIWILDTNGKLLFTGFIEKKTHSYQMASARISIFKLISLAFYSRISHAGIVEKKTAAKIKTTNIKRTEKENVSIPPEQLLLVPETTNITHKIVLDLCLKSFNLVCYFMKK